MDNMSNNNNANINSFKNEAKEHRLAAGAREYSLKDLPNDANMASKRKKDWSAITEKADQLHVRQAKMDLADLEASVASAEAARAPRYTSEEMEGAKHSSFSKGFWFGTVFTVAVGGFIAYKKFKNQRREIERLEEEVKNLKK